MMNISDEIVGARLQTARKALGLTQSDAGTAMGMVTSTVSAIEAGKRAVTGVELHSFSQLYGRPVAYFLDTEATQESPGFQFLLRMAAERHIDRDPLVLLEQVIGDYDLLEELVGTPPLPLPPDYSGFELHTDQDAETLAEMERARLGLGDAPITGLVDLLDATVGVRTFLVPVKHDDWSSLTVKDRSGRPCIAVNSLESGYRRQFHLAHAYGHVLVHLSRKDAPPARIESAALIGRMHADERFANAFAAAFLMPRRAVLGQLDLVLKSDDGRFTDFDLVHLAGQFGVSVQVTADRLVTLRKLAREASQAFWTEQDAAFNALSAMLGYEIADPHGFQDRPVVLPSRYRYLAMKAYEDDEISVAKLAELLREPYHDLRSTMERAVGSLHEV
jgi:Zn-dependent peptidase ImmA (M78 family)